MSVFPSLSLFLSLKKKKGLSAPFNILHGFQMSAVGCEVAEVQLHIPCDVLVRRWRGLGSGLCCSLGLVAWSLTLREPCGGFEGQVSGEWTVAVTHVCSWEPVAGSLHGLWWLQGTDSHHLQWAPFIQILQSSLPRDLFGFRFFFYFIKLRKYKMIFLLYILIAF